MFALIRVSFIHYVNTLLDTPKPLYTIFGTIYSKFSVTALSSFPLPEILSSYK